MVIRINTLVDTKTTSPETRGGSPQVTDSFASFVCELDALSERVGEISMPLKISRFQQFCQWALSLFGYSPSRPPVHALADATLAHLKGRLSKGYPTHEPKTTREMISKIFTIRTELLAPLRAHLPHLNELAEIDAILLAARAQYAERIEKERPRKASLSEASTPPTRTPTTASAALPIDDADAWEDKHKAAGYKISRTLSGSSIAQKGKKSEVLFLEGKQYFQVCDFNRGTVNPDNHDQHPQFTVSWVNGIMTSFSKTLDAAKRISSLIEAPVHYVNNPKKKFYTHAVESRKYIHGDSSTEEVQALAYHLRTLLKESDRDVLHICHSQGAALTKLAAKHLSADEKSRIHVRSFGGLLPIEESDGFASQENYISKGDALIISLNPKAKQAVRKGDVPHYQVIQGAGGAKKSHSFSAGRPYGQVLQETLAQQNRLKA